MGPMMQRIQGVFGSSLPRLDGFATGLAPLVAVLILPRGGLRLGYRTSHPGYCFQDLRPALTSHGNADSLRQFNRLLVTSDNRKASRPRPSDGAQSPPDRTRR